MERVEIAEHRGGKKYTARIYANGKVRSVSFGQKGAGDYVTDASIQRREAYLSRHRSHENWNDPYSAGFWSARLLWGSSVDIRVNAREISKFLGMPVVFV